MTADGSESASHLHIGAGIFTRKSSFFGHRIKERSSSNHHHHPHSPPDTQTTSNQDHDSATTHITPPSTPNSNDRFDEPPTISITPPRRRAASSRHSLSHSVTDFGSNLRRSASLRTTTSPHSRSSHKRTPSSTATLAVSFSPEKPPNVPNTSSRPTLSISTFSRKQRSTENVKSENGGGGPVGGTQGYNKSPLSAIDQPKTPFGMAVPLRVPPTQKEIRSAQQPPSSMGYGGGLGPAAPIPTGGASGSHNPNIIFQHIHDMASKRISTLDYLRKAHEGRIYWFNTLLFSKPDLSRLAYFDPRRLSRRATNFLLLGCSLPTILDLNANSPTDYLKALNALLVEFETYQTIHPPDGTTSSSLSRGRIPQMFKRATAAAGGKGRRSSSAASDFGSFNSNSEPMSAVDTVPPSFSPPAEPPTTAGDPLLPGEEYTHLLTPSLPFDPDFFETFATLCDVLIDSYTKIMSMISSPEQLVLAGGGVPSTVGDLFAKADARIRKIILMGIVKEFEETSRSGVKGEVAGVGKVVLGGLM